MIHDGKITRAVKFGNVVRIDQAELERFVADAKIATG
jgi:hypothetical protein